MMLNLRNAYFNKFSNVWHHGDYVEIKKSGGFVIYGTVRCHTQSWWSKTWNSRNIFRGRKVYRDKRIHSCWTSLGIMILE